MQLYSGSSQQFIDQTTRNAIAATLQANFFEAYRYHPSKPEVMSWQNSLFQMAVALQRAGLTDHGVALEYQLPLSARRLDFMITGHDRGGDQHAVVVELKQWGEVSPSDAEGCVSTWLAGTERDVLHPSCQVGQYEQYLRDVHAVFSSGDVKLSSCVFLHNLQHDPENEIFRARHAELLQAYPAFAGNQVDELKEYLQMRLVGARGVPVMEKVLTSKYAQSKKLLEHTANVVRNQASYVLLDDQKVVFNKVLSRVRNQARRKEKRTMILVEGGPGTGKSVIALHLLGELAAEGFSVLHATGSKAFTENIKKVVGSRAAAQFGYTHLNMKGDIQPGFFDALVVDEAHRIRAISATRFTKAEHRSGKPQIEELVDAAKVSVFFIDDLQVVRPKEVGSAELVRETARKLGAELIEFKLEAQFRCGGSDGFINWIDNTLGVRPTANVLWPATEAYEFGICRSIDELERTIRNKNASGTTARLVAGFCWPWSDPRPDGALVEDVQIGPWSMPWNASPDAGRLAAGIPKSNYWASDPGGIEQVGCIYTAQGFEFDYVGVIFGLDLRYDADTGEWIGDATKSADSTVKRSKEQFVELVKNTYRVLLTRGIKGCYVYFMDEQTRRFFQSRLG
ncbi:peptidase S24 [Cupriavidus necator]|uniref:DUF2075 domain-containing protein n=1 Tax=Cupriavidus necator TaxID=106590 RepID=UPI000735738E|nr:DUF2075 domain-containing protein [Cupriavidus necator]KUE88227.1 peptidase S24 [Cupriavidus necator]